MVSTFSDANQATLTESDLEATRLQAKASSVSNYGSTASSRTCCGGKSAKARSISAATVIIAAITLSWCLFIDVRRENDDLKRFPKSWLKARSYIAVDQLSQSYNLTAGFTPPDVADYNFSAIQAESIDGTVVAVQRDGGSIEQIFVEEDPSVLRELEAAAGELTLPSGPPTLETNDPSSSDNNSPAVHTQSFGTVWDNRRNLQTTVYPANINGHVRRNGGGWCSGALFANRALLTNAHCLYDFNAGQWYSGPFEWCPGQRDDSDRPYGCFEVSLTTISRNYFDQRDAMDDWGIMVLKTSPNLGYYGFSMDVPIGTGADMYHYSCGAPATCGWQYYERCPFIDDQLTSIADTDTSTADPTGTVAHECDTTGGSSGTPMTVDNEIRAVNAWGAGPPFERNYANRIRRYEYDVMLQYRAQHNDVV